MKNLKSIALLLALAFATMSCTTGTDDVPFESTVSQTQPAGDFVGSYFGESLYGGFDALFRVSIENGQLGLKITGAYSDTVFESQSNIPILSNSVRVIGDSGVVYTVRFSESGNVVFLLYPGGFEVLRMK